MKLNTCMEFKCQISNCIVFIERKNTKLTKYGRKLSVCGFQKSHFRCIASVNQMWWNWNEILFEIHDILLRINFCTVFFTFDVLIHIVDIDKTCTSTHMSNARNKQTSLLNDLKYLHFSRAGNWFCIVSLKCFTLFFDSFFESLFHISWY